VARILVVDDEDNILSLLGTILRLGGHEVLTANNEDDGFALLRRNDIELLVLDLRIGEFDGREFFRRARTQNYTGAVVIVSAYGALRAARELGADGAIEKPFEPTELMNEIDEVLARRRAQAPERDEDSSPSLFRLPRLRLGWA
jgi:DNA-binding response OmpR family regulator